VSYDERPDFRALGELQDVLRLLAEELAGWRRRAQRAEQALGVEHDAVAQRERVLDLEGENRDMADRLGVARERVGELLKRLEFLEEQMAVEEQAR
jgi:predicted TPR repeat methyltransferase